jgi:hypothetical protein
MFGKFDDDIESGTEVDVLASIIADSGIDFELDQDSNSSIITLDNGVTFEFDEDGVLTAINPPRKFA